MPSFSGKAVFNKRYFHIDALPLVSEEERSRTTEALALAGIAGQEKSNVVRFEDDSHRVALLRYRDFYEMPFPELEESWLVDLRTGQTSRRTYENSLNPPILHRKELLLAPDHPRVSEYSALTASAEQIGLFDNPTRIGFRVQWMHLVTEKGYRIIGHALVPIGNDLSDEPSEEDLIADAGVDRHRTALVRSSFSAPMQALARHGYLDGSHSVFDYGCGRGDDLRRLLQAGITAAGWDPHFAPDTTLQEADVVNLGFVINVIEDFDERVEALTRAYSLSQRLLVVSVMLVNEAKSTGERFNDGVLTKRNTFQKYYTQAEVMALIEAVLDEEPIPVAPGVLYVFRDKLSAQRFLANRQRTSRKRLVGTTSTGAISQVSMRAQKREQQYQRYRDVLESLWEIWLTLGRKPDASEVPGMASLIEGFGSLSRAMRFVASHKGPGAIERSQKARVADLSVYLALREFEHRKGYKQIESGLRRDIKAFFGTLKAATGVARELLFQIADTEAIAAACQVAAENGLGWYVPGESLQLHTGLVEQLPPVLRIYAGCALAMYGDYQSADLIKIHVTSGKLTLMCFNDFEGSPLPRMVERVKLKLREQDIEYYRYAEGEYEPPYLYWKSLYINEEFPRYPEQVAFDQQLAGLPFLDLSGHGPSPADLHAALSQHRWRIQEFDLQRSKDTPDLDLQCGRYLTYRQLIECGETQTETGIANLPTNPDSYSALLDLATFVLDPVIDYYGMIKLTYGFCSAELEKCVPNRIAPKLDQHAAHEKRRNGRHICSRLGAAVDFYVEDEDMEEVAEWIAANTPFDRLYFYGNERPLHVSYGPEHNRSFVDMIPAPNTGKLVPKVRRRSSG